MLAAVAAVGAVAPIRPLAREPPYAEGAALKKKQKQKTNADAKKRKYVLNLKA